MVECVPLGSIWEDRFRLKGARGITFKVWGTWGTKKQYSKFISSPKHESLKGQEEDRRLSGSFLQERQEMAGTQRIWLLR